MNSTPSPALHDWIASCFDKLQTAPDVLPAYQRFMLLTIAQCEDDENFDFLRNMDSLAEPDDPEMGTHADYLELHGKEFIRYLTESLKEGHNHPYAEAYANEQINDGCEDRVSAAAYKAIGANAQKWTVNNPGYQDVVHACLANGKDEDFAHRCARELPDREFFFKEAFEAALKYDKHIEEALSGGRSATFAQAYAEAWNSFAEIEDVALNYAYCFEKLVEANRTSDDADSIAYEYAYQFMESYLDDNEGDSDWEFEKSDALANAESVNRFRKLPPEEEQLPKIFLRLCRRRYPVDYSKHWFDEIESLARSVYAGELQEKDIQLSSFMWALEEDCILTEDDKPPQCSRIPDGDSPSKT